MAGALLTFMTLKRRSGGASLPCGASLRQALGLVLAQEALEEAPVALLVAQDVYEHVLRYRVYALGLLDDPGVVLDGSRLGLYDALDDVHDVRLLCGGLQVGLARLEVQRAGYHT